MWHTSELILSIPFYFATAKGDLAFINTTATTEMELTTTSWVTPFPEGDVLNDPFFREAGYVFPKNETLLVSTIREQSKHSYQLVCFGVTLFNT